MVCSVVSKTWLVRQNSMRQSSLVCPSYRLLKECFSEIASRQLHVTDWQTDVASAVMYGIIFPGRMGRLCCRQETAGIQMQTQDANTEAHQRLNVSSADAVTQR